MFKEMSEKNPYKYNGDALVVENINDNSKTKSVYIESYGCATVSYTHLTLPTK